MRLRVNALTPSFKVSAEESGYDCIIPSNRMMANFSDGIVDEDDVSMLRKEEEPQQHSVLPARCTMKNKICVLENYEKIRDNMLSSSLVRMFGLKVERKIGYRGLKTSKR